MKTTKKNPQLEALETALEQVRAEDFDGAKATLEELLAAIEAAPKTDPTTTEAARSLAQRAALPPRATRGTTFVTPNGSVSLTASELKECKRAGAKPEVYAANKARKEAAKRGGKKVSR